MNEPSERMIGAENLNPATAPWAIQLALAYLDHLVLAGEAGLESDGDEHVRRWRAR